MIKINLKATFKYQFDSHAVVIMIYYFFTAFRIFTILLTNMIDKDSALSLFVLTYMADKSSALPPSSSVYGLSVLMLFMVCLLSFKDTLNMTILHGVSRKTMFAGRVLTMISIGIFIAAFDKLIFLFVTLASSLTNIQLTSSSFYDLNYISHVENITTFQMHVESLLFSICFYLGIMALFYFITILFYRLPKYGKISVLVAVPISMIILIIIEIFSSVISNAFDFALGTTNQNPYHAIITFISMFMVLSILNWLLVKRAELKE